jgi:3-dehydroquinate synthase
MQILNVDLDDRSYPIYIGSDLLSQTELLQKHINGSQVLVVSNDTVAPIYLATVRESLKSYHYSEVI